MRVGNLKKFIFTCFCLFLLAACSVDIKKFEFVGQSEHWKVVYQYEIEYLKDGQNRSDSELKITYIGDPEKIPNGTVIEYNYTIGSKSGSKSIEFEEMKDSIVIEDSGSGVNLAILEGNEIGTINISWDGKSEEFEIKNADNQ